MESKDGVSSGVTVIAAEAPSAYQVAPRTENSTPVARAPADTPTPVTPALVSAGVAGTLEKKKRGRPRKYGPDGAIGRALSPMPISSSAPPAATINFSADKRGRGRPVGSVNKPRPRVGSENLGEWVAGSAGGNFTLHIIAVNAGEDVTMKIISFSQRGPRAICIISANGSISNVTIRQPDSSGGTLTYEGRFEILSLSGSFTPTEVGGSKVGRSGGMSVSLASPDGRVLGGLLAGLLIAASPVQVIVASFLPSSQQEPKPKKHKPEPKLATAPPGFAAATSTSDMGQKSFRAQDQNNSAAENLNIASSSTWATMPTVDNSRKSTTDINISLQGE